jgi:hypothetical protein
VAVAVVVAQVDAAGEVRVAAEVAPGPAPRRGTVGRRHCGAARHGTARILSKRLPPHPAAETDASARLPFEEGSAGWRVIMAVWFGDFAFFVGSLEGFTGRATEAQGGGGGGWRAASASCRVWERAALSGLAPAGSGGGRAGKAS